LGEISIVQDRGRERKNRPIRRSTAEEEQFRPDDEYKMYRKKKLEDTNSWVIHSPSPIRRDDEREWRRCHNEEIHSYTMEIFRKEPQCLLNWNSNWSCRKLVEQLVLEPHEVPAHLVLKSFADTSDLPTLNATSEETAVCGESRKISLLVVVAVADDTDAD